MKIKTRLIEKLCLKSVAVSLILSFSFSQLVWAVDVRQMILDAESSFDQDTRRSGNLTPTNLTTAQTQAQTTVDQQQALQDLQNTNFSLTTKNGDVLQYVGNVLNKVQRPDGTLLNNIQVDANGNITNANLKLSDGSIQIFQNGQVIGYGTPDGNTVVYSAGQIQQVISKTGIVTNYSYIKDSLGNVIETDLDNTSYTTKYDANNKLKEVYDKVAGSRTTYTNGVIQKTVKSDGSQILYNSAVQPNGDIIVTPPNSNSSTYTDTQGNIFTFISGNVSTIKLKDGSILDSIVWDASNAVQSANLTAADGTKYVYQNKQLTRSTDPTGVVTNYTYTSTNIVVASAGSTWVYDPNKNPISYTDLSGNTTTYLTSGAFKGLKDRDILSTGQTFVYEYSQNSSGVISVQKREVHLQTYNVTTYSGTALLASNNPYLLFDARFENDNSFDPKISASATGTGKSLAVNLVAGSTGSSFTFNGVVTALNVSVAKGTTYNVEIRWETGRIGIYVYPKGTTRPSTPQGIVTDRSWDPTFKFSGQNAYVGYTYDSATWPWSQRGAFSVVTTSNAQSYAYLPGTPAEKITLNLNGSYQAISLTTKQYLSGIYRTITFGWNASNSIWNTKVSDWNSSTNVTTIVSTGTVAQTLTSGTDYVFDLRIEGAYLNGYVYLKGQARPSTPTLSVSALSASTDYEAIVWGSASTKTELYKNLTAPTYSAAAFQAKPVTALIDTVKNLTITKPAAPSSNPTDYSSITYSSDSKIKQIVKTDNSKYIFQNGLLTQVLDPSGNPTNFNFTQSIFSNITGSEIVQNNLDSKYDGSGNLSQIKINDITIHYLPGSTQIDYIEKTDGTQLHNLVFDASGNIIGADITAPTGEIRSYQNGQLIDLTQTDNSQIFYANAKPLKIVTPDKLTYNFDYTTPNIVQAVLDPSIVPSDALTPVKMQYDTNFNLTKVIRQNNQILNYLNNSLTEIDAPSAAPQIFAYQKDANGNILSYTVTQGNIVTTYDPNNNPVSAVVNPTSDNPHTLAAAYQYGKIRQIKKDGVVTFNYTYAFDASNNEITQVDDLEENTFRTYQSGNLVTSLDRSTSLLSTYVYVGGQVSQVQVSRLGRNLHIYNYSYSGGMTVVTDDEGTIRTYDANKQLLYLEKNGQKFQYIYTTSTKTNPITIQTVLPVTTLSQVSQSTGSNSWQQWQVNSSEGSLGIASWGWVTYNATLSQASDLKIEFDSSNFSGNVPSGYQFNLDIAVDGVSKTQYWTPVVVAGWTANSLTLTGLSSGTHAVKITWLNDYYVANQYDANFKFRNLKMTQINTTTTTTSDPITQENLIEQKLSDGSVAHYSNGAISSITRPDGSVISDLTLDSNGQVTKGTVTLSNGIKKIFNGTSILEEIDPDGTHFYFSNNEISKVVDTLGKTFNYTYDTDAAGNVIDAWLDSGSGALLKYDPNGNLLGFKPNNLSPYINGQVSFSDSSSAQYAITRSATARLDAGLPVFGSGSAYFDGTSYLSVPHTGDWDFGTGDFTVDFQARFRDTTSTQALFSIGDYASNGLTLYYTNGNLNIHINSAAVSKSIAWTPVQNQWYHFALVRTGAAVKLFVNGTQAGTDLTNSSNISGSATGVYIGALYSGGTGNYLNGNIDEFRISKGIARWTSNFTPSTQAYTADSNAKLLLHFDGTEDKYFYKFNVQKDASGNLTGYSFDGAGGKMSYDAQGNFISTTLSSSDPGLTYFADSSLTKYTSMPFGNVHLDPTQSKLGSSSVLFDGSSYIAVPNSDDWDLGTGDFTIDSFVKFKSTAGTQWLAQIGNYSSHGVGLYFVSNTIYAHVTSLTYTLSAAWTPSVNTWYHVALLRSGSALNIYINGVQLPGTSNSTNVTGVTEGVGVGGSSIMNSFNGWMDEFRISKGLARWTGNFTPPTQPDVADSYTKLLMHFEDQVSADLSGISQSMSVVKSSTITLPYKLVLTNFLPDVTAWYGDAQTALLDNQTVIANEYSSDGTLQTQTKADGTVTLFDNNKPSEVLSAAGAILIQYSYDADGNPSRVYLKNARDTLPEEVLKAKQSIEQQRASSLQALAAQKNLAYQSIQTQVQAQRQALQQNLTDLQNQYNQVANTPASGKSAKNARGNVLNQIGTQMDLVRSALVTSYQQEADAYAALDAQVKASSDKIEADSQSAFTALATQEANLKQQILQQEVSPIVYDYYRRLLGRDPATMEYNSWIGKVDYSSGNTFVEVKTTDGSLLTAALKSSINSSQELIDRQTYVQNIKNAVTSSINSYLAMTQANQQAFAASLGLSTNDVINLTSSDAQKILTWLNSRSLHFGQSAFLSLESLLDQKGITYDRQDLAKKCILVDVLSGVITPLDDGDLVISVFALNKVASLYGTGLTAANVSYDDLLSLYVSQPTARTIAHINGDHFVVITAVTKDNVTYIDPGKGVDKQNESVTVSKMDFMKTFKGNVTLDNSKAQAIANISSKTLSVEQTKKIRGAFLPLLIAAIFSAISSIGSAVFAVANGIGTIIAGVGTIVSGALNGIGQALSILGQNLSYIGQAVFNGIKFAASTIYNLGSQIFASFAGQTLFPSLTQVSFGSQLFQTAVNIGVNFATQKGLDALGINPQIASLASAFVSGGTVGSFNSGFNAANFIQNGIKTLALVSSQTLLQRVGLDANLSSTLSLIVSPLVNGIQSGNIGGSLVKIIPDLTKNLSLYGVDKLGTSLGLDAGISSLAGVSLVNGLNAAFGGGTNVGQSVIQSIQSGLTQGIVQYGLNFVGNSNPIFGSLLSSDMAKNIELAIGRDGLFQTVFNVLQNTVLNAVNVVGGTVQSIFTGITDFGSLIQQKGLPGALQYYLNSVFSRNTQETILAEGGIQSIFNNTAKTATTLPDGTAGQELKISDSASLLFDNAGNLKGKKENGVIELGTFGLDSTGKFGLTAGQVTAVLAPDLNLSAQVNGGQLQTASVKGSDGTSVVDINPENTNQPIYIEGPQTQTSNASQSFDFWGAVLKLVPYGLSLWLGDASVQAAQQTASPNTTIQSIQDSTRLVYALANGIANPNSDETKAPDYIQNLEQNLKNQGNGQISDSDLLPIPLYQHLFQFTHINQSIDAIKWIMESQDPTVHGTLVNQAFDNLHNFFWKNGLDPYYMQRPIVGMGYSGGFMPLVEAIAATGGIYNFKSLVALGAATISLSQDLADAVVKTIQYIEQVQVSDIAKNFGLIFGSASNIIQQFINDVQNNLIDPAFTLLENQLESITRQSDPNNVENLPDLSNTNVQQIVNVWGTKDILAQTGIGGQKSALCGLSGQKLINVEIVGATHFDYMLRGANDPNLPDTWNYNVSNFVTALIRNSDNSSDLNGFLAQQQSINVTFFDSTRQVWVVKLSGWESHQ